MAADCVSRIIAGSGATNINHEFRDDVTTMNWRKSLTESLPRKPVGEIPAEIVVNPSLLAQYVLKKQQKDDR